MIVVSEVVEGFLYLVLKKTTTDKAAHKIAEKVMMKCISDEEMPRLSTDVRVAHVVVEETVKCAGDEHHAPRGYSVYSTRIKCVLLLPTRRREDILVFNYTVPDVPYKNGIQFHARISTVNKTPKFLQRMSHR